MTAVGWPFFFIALIVFSITFTLSGVFARRVLLADKPNERSSHTQTVSRAGGIAIITGLGVGTGLIILVAQETGTSTGLLLGLILMASLLGLADDLYNLRPAFKFAGQLLLAIAMVMSLGAITVIPLPFIGAMSIGVLGIPLSIFWVIGVMNAYNFMDGANGLAASVGALILLVLAVLAAALSLPGYLIIAFFLALALVAFLPMNLLQGKIFMGDSGSQAVSFTIAALAILLSHGTAPFISALMVPVVMMPFIVDVTFTLTHRFRRRQPLTHAHREHLYQLLMRQGFSHGEVCAIYLGASAVSAAAALLMLRLPVALQWLVPVILLVIMWGVGLRIYQNAEAAGLLPNSSMPQADQTTSAHQPAE